jgi:hypothetical protein
MLKAKGVRMAYWVNHLMGNAEQNFSIDSLPSLYDELAAADGEYTDVSLTHESEWCLSAFASGLVVWENVAGKDEPKHMIRVPKEKTINQTLGAFSMNPELHEAVHEIVLEIVNASKIGDKKAEWTAYQKLVSICEKSEEAGRNHPFQWETLGDFTHDRNLAVGFYEKALSYAHAAELDEYVSSISLVMAETLIDLGNTTKARIFAAQANQAAEKTNDLELRANVSELLLRLSST